MADTPKIPADFVPIVCYTQCWPCQFGSHFDPPQPHTWMDEQDAAHAGHPWPLSVDVAAQYPCACECARSTGADHG